MQTEDIILWVDKAIEVKEQSYEPPPKKYIHDDNIEDKKLGNYKTSMHKALEQTRPEEAKNYDYSIALWMVGYSSDVSDWKKEIEFQQLIEAERQSQEQISKMNIR